MNIVETKPGRLEEALEVARKRIVMFHQIEGFESSIEVQSTAAEALARLGLGTHG